MARNRFEERYENLLTRLRGREGYEPPPRSRGPEKLVGVRALLDALGRPQEGLRIVHVAGTNGKGMTAKMVADLLGRAGYRTGLYTSPHLVDIRERIALAGRPIAKPLFLQVATTVLDLAEEVGQQAYLSYFDLLTAMGLLAFRESGMEWAVLETGLGGFSDATNVTEKELCVLTRIGMDHMSVLGNTLEQIAGQKLGILRRGVPVVVAPQPAELRGWLEAEIETRGAPPVIVPDQPPAHQSKSAQLPGAVARITLPGGESVETGQSPPRLTLPRLVCAATALAVANLLLGSGEEQEQAERLGAALEASVPGRLDYREQVGLRGARGTAFPVAVLDGGHNAPALEALAEHLAGWNVRDYTLIFGMQKDKMVEAARPALRRLLGGARRIITLLPATPRSPKSATLHDFLRGILPDSDTRPELHASGNARDALLAAAQTGECPLVVAGSFWMVGDVMAELDLPDMEEIRRG